MSSLSFSSPISKLKVLMTESSPNFGGQQYRLVRETLWLRANGHEPLVLCGTHSRLAHHLAHHARSVPVSKIDVWQSPLALAALFRIARRWRPDVIHVRSSQDSFWGSFLHATGWPVVRSRHMLVPAQMAPWRALPYRSGCTRIMAAAGAIKDVFVNRVKIPPGRIDVVGEGVDLEEFHPGVDGTALRAELGIPNDAVVFGMVAMVRGEKGHWRFVNAAARVAKEHPNARFLIVGDGSPAQVKKLCSKIASKFRGKSSPLLFAGYREDIPSVMAAIDVLVVPSMEDAQTLVIPQAFATGRPVIASRVGGIPELVANGKNGLLIPPGDEIELAAAMSRLANAPDLRAALGREGLALARSELSFSQKMELLLECYRKAIEAKRPAARATV